MNEVDNFLDQFAESIEYLKHLLQNQDSFERPKLKVMLVEKQDALESIERLIVERIANSQATAAQQYTYWRLRQDFLQTIQNLSHKRQRRANSLDENTWERVNISETKSRTFIVAHETQNDSCSSSSTPTQKPNQKQTTPTPKIQNNQNSNTNIINNSNNNNSNNENNQNNNNVDESQLQQQQQIQIQIQQQQTMHDNYQTKEDILNDIVKERNQKIKQIKHDLESVHDLMQEIQVLVSEQSEALHTLEMDARKAESQTNSATYQIADASRASAKSQWDFKFKLLATALGGTVGLVGAGPFGLAIGTGVGLGFASYVGKKFASFKTWQIDEEMFKFQIAKNWVKDEDVTNCTKCKMEFTFWYRRHHCRFCYQIFCASCSSQNLPMKVSGAEQPRAERSCDICYQRYWNGDTWIADHGRQIASPPVQT